MSDYSNNFSSQMARAMAAHSARAYSAPTVTDKATNASALITVDQDGDIIVAFKGSSTPMDFIEDAKFWMEPLLWSVDDCQAKVHDGFLHDFEAINVAVVSQVRTYLDIRPAAKVFVTGHSLGGALAILAALEFVRQKLPVMAVYTFGQPRVGNNVFADIYNAVPTLQEMTYRVVNQNDIVPRTPGLLLGYRHCGQEVFLPPGGSPSFNPSFAFKVLCDCIGLYGAYRNREDVLISDHRMPAYQARIQNL